MQADTLNTTLLYLSMGYALLAIVVPLALLLMAWKADTKQIDIKRKATPWRTYGGGGRIE